uniref:Uncharacterized protein n=1 Tax=Peronospora matthiolae TaxID=2874970 RepID=A0AAV1VH79_9STRA
MATETSEDASLKKRLPWLKRLREELEDDDSSDSSLQMADLMAKCVVRPTKKAQTPRKKSKAVQGTEGKSSRRVKPQRRESDQGDSQGAGLAGGGTAKHKKKRLLKENDKSSGSMRHYHQIKAVKEELSIVKMKKVPLEVVKALVLNEHHTQKRHGHQAHAGENDSKIASKKPRPKRLSEARIKKERIRGSEFRLERDQVKVSAGTACRRQLVSQPTVDRTLSKDEHAAKCKVSKAVEVKMATKVCEHAKSPVAVTSEIPVPMTNNIFDLEKRDGEESVAVEPSFPVQPTSTLANCGDEEKNVLVTTEPKKAMADDRHTSAVMEQQVADCVLVANHGGSRSVSCEPEKANGSVKARIVATDGADTIVMLNDSKEADGSQTCVTVESIPHDISGPLCHDSLKVSPSMVTPSALESMVKDVTDRKMPETPVAPPKAECPTRSLDSSAKNGHEKSNRKLALQTMLAPCKATNEVKTSATSLSGSFVIPKRCVVDGGTADETVVASVRRVQSNKASADTRSVVSSKLIAVSRLPSLDGSEKSLMVELSRPLTRRSKNPVPIVSASSCTQDRAFLRLSRNRNSIYMAAIELAAGTSDLLSTKRIQTLKMGYEVYSVDGKALPDLISRYSCATSGEMAISRERYTASFFGVSLSPPKAAGNASVVVDGHGNDNLDARTTRCYEELRFTRPDDREFFQQNMYGTAFVPQHLRGQITLIVRNARFERKSTGIRFNQDRDRENFAVSMSKRYALGKSVPRCEITRESWQRLMKGQLNPVYLHYYNREDGERALHTYRDDLGHALELKSSLKAGAVLQLSSCQAAKPNFRSNPGRSLSSERTIPESSPLSSQNCGTITPIWQREYRRKSKGDDGLSKYGRNAPRAIGPRCEKERQHDGIDGGRNRLQTTIRCRSRSRSKSKSSYRQGDAGALEKKVEGENSGGSDVPHSVDDARERIGSGNVNIMHAIHNDVGTPALKRARISHFSPRQSSSYGFDGRECEKKRDLGRTDEENRGKAGHYPTTASGGDDGRYRQYRAHSPLRRKQPDLSIAETSERRNPHANYSRNHSRITSNEHQFHQQRTDPAMNMRRSRSRSRSRSRNSCAQRARGYSVHNDRFAERRENRSCERAGAFGNDTYERRMSFDRGHSGFDGRSGGVRSRPR